MSDLYITHKETYSFSQSKLGREYAKKIADVWRGEGLIVEEQETTWYLEFDTRYARLSALGVPQVSDKLGRQEKRQKKMQLIYGTGGPKHEDD